MEPIEKEIELIRSKLNSLEIQIQMMNPASYIEFRGEIIATLKSLVSSIESLEREFIINCGEHKEMRDKGETVLNDIKKDVQRTKDDINKIKIQAAVIAVIIAGIATALGNVIVRKLFGE